MAHCLAMWSNVRKHGTLFSNLKPEIGNITYQPTTSLLNLCSLYKGLNSKKPLDTTNVPRTAPIIIIQTVAESEKIRTNHLEFAKSLFQYYHTHLGLTNNNWPTELVFNCYVNERIVYYLEGQGDPKSTFNNFFSQLLQSTILSQNYLFTLLITEINREIEKYTKQKFSITFADKDKGRLQTPIGTPKQIQLPTWKKQRFDSPANLSYYHIPGNIINIINTVITSATTLLNRILFQRIQLPPLQPDFGAVSPWKITDFEKEESSNREVNKQNPILEHLEIKTLVNQTLKNQNNQNPNVINQHLLPVIVINLLLAPPNAQQQQQPQLLSQQQIQQQPQPNLDPMAYAPIAKLKKFTGEEDDAQLMNRIMPEPCKPSHIFSKILPIHDTKFLQYFSNNNSINRLANTFTTIKQRENKAVTTYLRHFYRNLHQIQAINANYFTMAQILNQFICRLRSSILQCIHLLHLINLQTAVTNAQDFEAAEFKANHAQAINLVINGSSELDFKLKQFSDSINQKLKRYLADNCAIYQPPQQCNNSRNVNHFQNQAISSELHTYDTAVTLSFTSISSTNLSTDKTNNLSATVTTYLSAAALGNLSALTNSNTATELTSKWNPKAEINPTKLEIINDTEFRQWNLGTEYAQNLNSQNYLSLLVITEDAQPNNLETNQQPTLISNILPATITENELLDTIFPFKLEELLTILSFSGTALEEKPIMAMYTDAKVDGHFIKLILNSGSAGSIITKQLMNQLGCQVNRAVSTRIITADGATKTSIGEIDDFPIEVNSIMVPIKVLVIEATQYQALIGNDWLSKNNVLLDWNTQKLQISQNS
ncbi:hypothetical protein G9A89_013385 [Geosiphon pyriformis]|nr:hypothetical protein G9A89_013385 [Geosiphon pyriformis]